MVVNVERIKAKCLQDLCIFGHNRNYNKLGDMKRASYT